jgi:hypothetical protein
MKIKPIKAEYIKVLQRIQDSIPTELLAQVTKRERIAQPVEEIIERALIDPEVSQETKERFQMVKDSGYLDREIDVENREVTRKIDQFIESEIEKAVKRGELPKGKKFRNLDKKVKRIIKTKYGKGKKSVSGNSGEGN